MLGNGEQPTRQGQKGPKKQGNPLRATPLFCWSFLAFALLPLAGTGRRANVRVTPFFDLLLPLHVLLGDVLGLFAYHAPERVDVRFHAFTVREILPNACPKLRIVAGIKTATHAIVKRPWSVHGPDIFLLVRDFGICPDHKEKNQNASFHFYPHLESNIYKIYGFRPTYQLPKKTDEETEYGKAPELPY